MKKIKKELNNFSKIKKFICLISLLGFVLFFSVAIPTFARYKNRVTIINSKPWDGSVATSYKSGTGTESDPYVISNGSELAYLSSQLSSNNYEGKYFILTNDIILNSGVFNYTSENLITYTINNATYYLNKYTNKYYSTTDMTGTESGTINIFNPMNNFKGILNGNSHTISGLYITSNISQELGLFTSLYGDVSNLYIDNSLIYGGITTGGIASNTIGASLNNILFKGFVIGKNIDVVKNINYALTTPSISVLNTETINPIDLTNNIPIIGGTIVSTSITGNYTLSGATEAETTIKINGTTVSNGSFNIELGTSILNDVDVSTITTSTEPSVTLTVSNLSYNITYNYGISGGIVAFSNDASITNVINKSYVYSYSVSGGLVGVTNDTLDINNSYNIGIIKSEKISGGLIGSIEKSSNNITINDSYNIGDSYGTNVGGLIGEINNNTGTTSIENSFNTVNHCIYNINNSMVNVTNSYFVGTTSIYSGSANGTFTTSTINDLKSKSYITSNLLYSEFVSYEDLETNPNNIWVFESDRFPILYIDDISNPVANINLDSYSWNNFSYELNTLSFDSNITLTIEDANELSPLKEKYYYITNSSTPLTLSEISQVTTWTSYTNDVEITDDGLHIIYVKAVDSNDNVTYLNTDILSLDSMNPVITANLNNKKWSAFNTDLDYTYIGQPSDLTIDINENYTMSNISYYVSNTTKTIVALEALNIGDWTAYSSNININNIGTNIVYIKAVDTENNTYYINTGYIIYNGYSSNLIIGKNASSYQNEEANITNKSLITLDFNYTNSFVNYISGYNHNLITNILLPVGTKIKLIDNNTKKVYYYNISTDSDIYNYNNSCQLEGCIKTATYSFSLFKEIGTNSTNKYFDETINYSEGSVDEDFTVIFDLSNTNMTINQNDVEAYLELRNSNGEVIIPTIYNTIDKFNIYSLSNNQSVNAELKLSTTFNSQINLNSDSINNISINSGLDYKYDGTKKIIDTTFEDKKIGILIKFVDESNNILSNEYLKNLSFKVGDNTYTADSDGLVRINFNDGIIDVTKDLIINTYINNSDLEKGTYYLKIYSYVSDDGYYYDNLGNTELVIPVVVENNYTNDYSFDVLMDNVNHIIDKTNTTQKIDFKILQNGNLTSPNIRVSLYTKNMLSAVDQNYSIIDLSNFVSNELTLVSDNIYYVSSSPLVYDGNQNTYNNFELNFVTSNLEKTGYKLLFDLYDGDKKIGTITKYLIVK